MKKKGPITAGELMAQLNKDPKYKAKHKAQLKSQAIAIELYDRAEAPILRDIKNAGFKLSSLYELHHMIPKKEIVELLVKWLPNINNERVLDAIVRALAASKTPFSGTVLSNVFEETTSQSLRWTVANTIAEARPSDISEWVLETFKNVKYGKSREMLALAVARLVDPQIANEVLVSMFNEFPGHVSLALAECGGVSELSFLKSQKENYKGWIKKEIDKAIKKIATRVR